MADGTSLREQLLGLCDVQHRYTYSMVESPIAVKNYLATLRLNAVTEDDSTFAQWNAAFDVAPDLETQTVNLVRTIFREGLNHLDQIIGVMD